jgi:hypothetical protein
MEMIVEQDAIEFIPLLPKEALQWKDCNGYTLIMRSFLNNRSQLLHYQSDLIKKYYTVKELIKAGADVTSISKKWRTALILAKEAKYEPLIALIDRATVAAADAERQKMQARIGTLEKQLAEIREQMAEMTKKVDTGVKNPKKVVPPKPAT